MKNNNKIIFALDVSTKKEAKQWVLNLEKEIGFFKIGLELFLESHFNIIDWISARGHDVMLDLKLYDIPRTVEAAIKQISKHKIKFTTIYSNYNAVRAAVKVKSNTKLLLVNRLTSEIKQINKIELLKDEIIRNACLKLGADGIISPAPDASNARKCIGSNPLIVSPGIRWHKNCNDDQSNVATPSAAIKNGVNYLVIGRPIRLAKDPLEVVQKIKKEVYKC